MPAGRLAGLALDAEAGVEERVVGRREGLCPLPRHCPVAVSLAWRRGDDQRRVLELRAVQRAHVLDDQLRGIAMITAFVTLDVKADHVDTLGEQTFRPAPEAAIEVDSERPCHGFRYPSRLTSSGLSWT